MPQIIVEDFDGSAYVVNLPYREMDLEVLAAFAQSDPDAQQELIARIPTDDRGRG